MKTFTLSMRSLLLQPLRSGLAIVGIWIGITAVIWLVAMGNGVSQQAQDQIRDLGAKNVIVRTVKPSQNSSAAGGGMFLSYGLKRADFKKIAAGVPWVEQAVPIREMRKTVRNDQTEQEVRVVGCTPEYLDLNQLTVERGRFITEQDGTFPPKNVCVLGGRSAVALFGFENPVGRVIQVDTDFYRIVGQTSQRDPTAAIGGNLDSQDYNFDVYIPLKTLYHRIGDQTMTSRSGSREGEIVELNQITLSVADIEQIDDTADIVDVLVKQDPDHKSKEDVALVVPKELLKQAELLQKMFQVLGILIASISLIVGGIGIMNIMLATVTERTREIGIRRAIGAKKFNIIWQFMTEAVVLTGIGGIMGVSTGFLVGPVVTTALAYAKNNRTTFPSLAAIPENVLNMVPIIEEWSVYASFCIAVIVGVIFGLLPAWRAAQMDPIEALRHE